MSGSGSRRPSRRTLLVYLAAWLAVGAAVVLVAVALLDGGSDADGTLPPVHQTALESAAHAAGCRLESRRSRGGGAPEAAAPGGSYGRAPSAGALRAALRHGTVVLRYRPGLTKELVSKLLAIQKTIPRATILTPGTGRMRDAVEMTAYRRLLACPRLSTEGIDALRLFQGRYLGSGPGQ